MNGYAVGLALVALLFVLGGASAPLAAMAAALAWVKGAPETARLGLLAAVCLLGTWTTYLFAALFGWPPELLWLIPLAALLGNALAAAAGGRARGGALRTALRYLAGVAVGLGPPIAAVSGRPRGVPDLPTAVLVWGGLGVAWALIAGVGWLWAGVLALPTPEREEA